MKKNLDTKLILRHVPVDKHEIDFQKLREKKIQPYNEEEEKKAIDAAKQAINGN